jgi:hypothetical protein
MCTGKLVIWAPAGYSQGSRSSSSSMALSTTGTYLSGGPGSIVSSRCEPRKPISQIVQNLLFHDSTYHNDTSTYRYVPVCTGVHLYWYVLVCIGMDQYILVHVWNMQVCTGMCLSVLFYTCRSQYIPVCTSTHIHLSVWSSMYWYVMVHTSISAHFHHNCSLLSRYSIHGGTRRYMAVPKSPVPLNKTVRERTMRYESLVPLRSRSRCRAPGSRSCIPVHSSCTAGP